MDTWIALKVYSRCGSWPTLGLYPPLSCRQLSTNVRTSSLFIMPSSLINDIVVRHQYMPLIRRYSDITYSWTSKKQTSISNKLSCHLINYSVRNFTRTGVQKVGSNCLNFNSFCIYFFCYHCFYYLTPFTFKLWCSSKFLQKFTINTLAGHLRLELDTKGCASRTNNINYFMIEFRII